MSEFESTPKPWTGLTVPDCYGVFLWWPHEGTDWIHPEDIKLCEQLIPSNRVFFRQRLNSEFSQYLYGKQCIRLRPAMWLEIETDGYLIGDRVEIRSKMGRRRPAIATIEDMYFNRHRGEIEYHLLVKEQRLEEPLYFADIQPAFKLDQAMSLRQKALMDRCRIR
jgi:hypothetical protein